MNRFAELLDRLAYEPGRNNKLRLITAYFRDTPDPDRGYALAALTGALSFKHAKPGLIRDLIADRTDPVLFALSYDYVGDLSETVALMWPKSSPSPACGGGIGGLRPPSLRTPMRSIGYGWGSGRLLGGEKEPHPYRPTALTRCPTIRPPPQAGEVRDPCGRYPASTTTRRRPPSPRSSPPFVPSARPTFQNSSRAGSTNSTRPAAGRC